MAKTPHGIRKASSLTPGVVGGSNGAATGSGEVGEVIFAKVTDTTACRANGNSTNFEISSTLRISLTKGVWLVTGKVDLEFPSGTTITRGHVYCYLSEAAASIGSSLYVGQQALYNFRMYTNTNAESKGVSAMVAPIVVRCDGANIIWPDSTSVTGTTLYFNAVQDGFNTVSNNTLYAYTQAVRIA